MDDPAWSKLILWLQSRGMAGDVLVCSKLVPGAGRGLFTTRDVLPNTPLFTIPSSAHMNIKTLRPLYKSVRAAQTLTAFQMISMHIFLHRPNLEECECSSDIFFGPYISILPRNFDGHPLSWRICPQENMGFTHLLLSSLPPGVDMALKMTEHRFLEDWRKVSELLSKHTDIATSTCSHVPIAKIHISQYLWAWLNVNTRCVYSQISSSPSDQDNVTLCPVLDLANHKSASTYAPSTSPIPTFLSPPNHGLRKGQEVYLRYGSHSNTTLFTEYGFIDERSENCGQADVQYMVERLFQEKGPLGQRMKTTLTEMNYWGDWKLYESPSPAHPSYRLLPALRLLHLSPPPLSNANPAFDDIPGLTTWRETLIGTAEIVSEENESCVWKTLEEICRVCALYAEGRRRAIQRDLQAYELTGWMEYAAHAVLSLWLEQEKVCQVVRQSIIKGELTN